MAPRYGAWRFDHPDFDAGEATVGLSISAKGGIAMVHEEASVRQAILILLSTRPGERVMRPDYGCELHQLLFSPNDDTTAGLAIHYVREAIERWEPRIQVLRLDAGRDGEYPERLNISLTYRLKAALVDQQLELSINLLGDET
jgi:uncharacterized protein